MLKRLAETFQSGLNTAVAATRDGVNRALPGNPALRDYDVTDQCGTGGAHGLWDIYDAVKKTGKTTCSVWIFDKHRHLTGLDKEAIVDMLKHGVLSLCRLQHPRILSVERRLEESTYSLVFVTERVQGCLSYLLAKKDVETDSSSGLFDVELRYGLLQVIEALAFIHQSAKLFHCNLTPSAISVTDKGSWKLTGLEFSRAIDDDNFKYEENQPAIALPCPSVLAPELFERKVLSFSADCFALGMLLYQCYTGTKIVDCSPYDAFRVIPQSTGKYTSPPLIHRLPPEVRDHCKMLINPSPDLRPTPDQLRSISFFQSAGALTLHYLDTLLQRPMVEKEQFFTDLPSVLDQLPSRVRTGLVMNALTPEFANMQVLPTLLPSVFKIIELSSGADFVDRILPLITDLFATTSAKACLILISNLPLMLEKLIEAKKPDHIRNYLLPLLGKALAQEKQSHLQAISLEVIPKMAEHLDEATIKSSLVPKVKNAALSPSCSVPVKVSILVALGQLFPRLDRWFIMDSILDWVPKMIERNPAVLVSALGCYQMVLTNEKLGMTKEFIANNALPTLLPLSMDSTLSLEQFQKFMGVIRLMLDKIEQEQTNKLRSMSDQNQVDVNSSSVSLSAIRGANTIPSSSGLSSTTLSPGLGSLSVTAAPAMVPASSGMMSLHQKEAEIKRLQLEKQFKQQSPITPSGANGGANQKKSSSQPKDLTATLMEKNMINMAKPNMNNMAKPAMNMAPMSMNVTPPTRSMAPTTMSMAPPTRAVAPSSMSMAKPTMTMAPSTMNQNKIGHSHMNPMSSSSSMGNFGNMMNQPMMAPSSSFNNFPSTNTSNMTASKPHYSMNTMQQPLMSSNGGSGAASGGWKLPNPMTAQGHPNIMTPTTQNSTGSKATNAKRLTAADIDSLLG